mmetsp:Transcript_15480/g.27356  ORF Transcript_15480/g.27356 Transcript_15480/m.27356 type:complete len:81 (+) Transcript_15480:395-637(+)
MKKEKKEKKEKGKTRKVQKENANDMSRGSNSLFERFLHFVLTRRPIKKKKKWTTIKKNNWLLCHVHFAATTNKYFLDSHG